MKKFICPKKNNWLLLTGLLALIMIGCKEKATQQQLEEKVFVVNIAADSTHLNEYLAYHKQVWPEVEAGFKKAGYKKIVLYRYDHLLVMTVAVPEGADLNEMGKIAESYSPRCAEWNKMMSRYQVGVAGTAQGQTWVEAKPFYSFSN
jgi:L-rhamnose mutarotase